MLVVLFLGDRIRFSGVWFYEFSARRFRLARNQREGGSELNCSEDFTLKYNVGAGGVSAGGEAKALSLIYTDAAVKATGFSISTRVSMM